MIVRLLEPCSVTSTNNWMITAEGLNDLAGWSRFHPCSDENSERTRFERLVREQCLHPRPCLYKTLLRPGVCVFEYDWNLDEDSILEHAMSVASLLKEELVVGGNPFHTNYAA